MVNPQLPSSPGTEDALVAEAERLLRLGEPLLAYNAADTGLQRWPEHLRLRQLQALALARSGDTERANRILTELAQAGVDDAETLGVLARTHKDLGLRAKDPVRRSTHLESAYRLYEQAYSASLERGSSAGAYYTGINAATVAVLRGQLEEARWLAADVLRICHQAAGSDPQSAAEYWRQATLGEAALILGDAPAAARHYANATALAQDRYGDLSSTRRQTRLLAAHLPIDDAWLGEVLRIPPVLVFTGNMVDQAGRATPRFPAGLEPAVARAIDHAISAIRPLAAYGSAACGADILCLERVHASGGEIHVVLPFPPEEFRRTSVDVVPGEWGARFDRLLQVAHSVTITSDHRATGSQATFEYANLVLTGLGQLRAQLLDTTLRGLAVWDRSGGGARGGSASVVSLWEARGVTIDHVNLGYLRQEIHSPSRSAEWTDDVADTVGTQHAIKALLFADAVGYSQLSEDQIPRYVSGFLGAVADLNRRTRHRFEHVETAGDGLYMVFDDVLDAAHYALELSALATGTDWTAHGLPSNFNLRIALHCGPVYCGRDPVTESPLYTGPHTSRAARIEPITPPGQVYASSAFAAVAAARGADGVTMRYVGKTPLAKRSGSLALYHLQPAH
jgi:class 3 adenylate cyclase/tetratricopeptide (TPR) repeat protein